MEEIKGCTNNQTCKLIKEIEATIFVKTSEKKAFQAKRSQNQFLQMGVSVRFQVCLDGNHCLMSKLN